MHTQRNQHICGLDFTGCYIPLDALQASRGSQMLSRENQMPHYTAHVGTQADGTHLSAGTFSFYNAAWKDKKRPPRCSKILQVGSSGSVLQVGRFALSFPFCVSNPSCSSQGRPFPTVPEQTLWKSLFLPTIGVPTSRGRIRLTMNCWATEQRTRLRCRQLDQEVLCPSFKLWQLLSVDFCLHLCRKQIHFMCWSTDTVWHARLSVHSFFYSCSHKWKKKRNKATWQGVYPSVLGRE